MTTIKGMLQKLQTAQASFNSDLELAVRFVADDLIDLQRDQLFDGIGNDGKILGRYSKATEEITQGLSGVGYPKREGDPFNFYASGSLFKSWKYRFQDNSTLELYATDSKFSELNNRYPGMVGLTDFNNKKFNYELLLKALRGTVNRHF